VWHGPKHTPPPCLDQGKLVLTEAEAWQEQKRPRLRAPDGALAEFPLGRRRVVFFFAGDVRRQTPEYSGGVRQVRTLTGGQAEGWTCREAGRQTDVQTDRQMDRRTDGQTDIRSNVLWEYGTALQRLDSKSVQLSVGPFVPDNAWLDVEPSSGSCLFNSGGTCLSVCLPAAQKIKVLVPEWNIYLSICLSVCLSRLSKWRTWCGSGTTAITSLTPTAPMASTTSATSCETRRFAWRPTATGMNQGFAWRPAVKPGLNWGWPTVMGMSCGLESLWHGTACLGSLCRPFYLLKGVGDLLGVVYGLGGGYLDPHSTQSCLLSPWVSASGRLWSVFLYGRLYCCLPARPPACLPVRLQCSSVCLCSCTLDGQSIVSVYASVP
jgi:hypothetical protein